MNSKVVKIMVSVILVLSIVYFGVNTVFAATPESLLNTLDSKVGNDNTTNTTKIMDLGASIISIITTAGVVIAVVVLMILGVKYMMGSAEEKAEYKKTMIPYLIGAVLIFAASAIAKVVIQFASSI